MSVITRSLAIKFGALPADSFVYGTSFPTDANTGYRTSLTVQNGDVTLNAGDHLSGIEFRGFVVVNSNDASLTDCNLVGRAPGGTFRDSLITGLATNPGFKMNFCTIAPQDAAQIYYMNGIGGKNIETFRCRIKYCVDSWHTSSGGNNMWDSGSYSSDLAFYMFNGSKLGGPGTTGGDHATDSRWPGATHNDHFQPLGGTGHKFLGTRMDGLISTTAGNAASLYGDTTIGFGTSFGTEMAGKWGACFTVTPKGTTAVTGSIKQCWLDGTEVQFQMPFQGGTNPASGNNWEYSGNRHGMPHPYASGTRYEHARMTSGMGTITAPLQNVYMDCVSVNSYPWVTTTSPQPVAGASMPGTINPLSLTTRTNRVTGGLGLAPLGISPLGL